MEPFDLKEKDENLIGSKGDMEKSEIKKKKMKRLLILISVILLVIIIVLVLYFSLRSDEEDSEYNKDKCKKGENENCLSCVKESEKFASCNPNFRL